MSKMITPMKQTKEKNVGPNRSRADPLFWELYDLVVAERDVLEKLVRQLSFEGNYKRTYPEILPKYRNPKDPNETWCGRGLQPRWLRTRLQAGEKLSDFLIRPTPTSNENSAKD